MLFLWNANHVTTHLVGHASVMIAGALPTGLAATVILIIGFLYLVLAIRTLRASILS
jgi:hypothetical protein